jgi:hypothetical protein
MEIERFCPVFHTVPLGGHFVEELVLHHFAEDVSDENMSFLNTRGAGGGDDKGEVSHFCEHSSIVSGKSNRFHPHLFSYFKGFDDIGGVSARADADGHISFLTEGSQLFGEDLAKRNVIRNAGENRGVCREGDGRERRAVHDIPVDEFCSQVLRVRRASTISEEEDFVSHLEGMRDQFDQIEESGKVLFEKTCFNFRAFLKSLQNDVFHRTQILYPLCRAVKDAFLFAHPAAGRVHGAISSAG